MPDYKEMYLIMARAIRDAEELNSKANEILIEAMRKCEEIYIAAEDESNDN